MNGPTTLPTTPPEHPAMDYAFLREQGIRHLERLAGQRWTDFNAHDPGITILEQLCYAITDLSYRIDYDIKDLLASGDPHFGQPLYRPAEILTNQPVTLTDLRKVVIDVPGVKNAWIQPVETHEPALFFDPADQTLYTDQSLYSEAAPHREPLKIQGVWRVMIETDRGSPTPELERQISRRLHACRALCEDFQPLDFLKRQEINVSAHVEIGDVEDPQRLLAEIYHALDRFISPCIRFYTLDEMLARGKSMDEIFDGPVLQHGFIDTQELEGFQRRTALRTSDLVRVIMDVEGVVAVGKISLAEKLGPPQAWYLELDRYRTPVLNVDAGSIQLVRGKVVAQPDAKQVRHIFRRLQEAGRYPTLPRSQRDVPSPAGRDRNVANYYSVQHQFPEAYGIGQFGLPRSAPPHRHAQAKQLKAYLMFFDQLLANYFAQLAGVRQLFSFGPDPRDPDRHDPNLQTYFSQSINDPTLGLDQIRFPGTEAPAPDEHTDHSLADHGRRNRFLNHLMARFAEEVTDYSLLTHGPESAKKLIADKCDFLRDYREIGGGRGRAFDYTRPSWDTDNVSGLEKRICRKLGLSQYERRDLVELQEADEGGFHMLEHILLRPQTADADRGADTTAAPWQPLALLASPVRQDPYSRQLSFVFPNWIDRFRPEGFRSFIEQTLRDETPAHLFGHLHWLDRADMRQFEPAYKNWLAARTVS